MNIRHYKNQESNRQIIFDGSDNPIFDEEDEEAE
jgi:hypothetical protein